MSADTKNYGWPLGAKTEEETGKGKENRKGEKKRNKWKRKKEKEKMTMI